MLDLEKNIIWKRSSGRGRTFPQDGFDVRLYYKASEEGKKAKLNIIFGRTAALAKEFKRAMVSSLAAHPTMIYLKFVDEDVDGSYKISVRGKTEVRIQTTLEPDEEMAYLSNWRGRDEYTLYRDENGIFYINSEAEK